jgi:hypothetical protein
MKGNWVDLDPEFVDIGRALSWAKETCTSYITNEAVIEKHPRQGRYGVREITTIKYRFYFSNEAEQALFALKWLPDQRT